MWLRRLAFTCSVICPSSFNIRISKQTVKTFCRLYSTPNIKTLRKLVPIFVLKLQDAFELTRYRINTREQLHTDNQIHTIPRCIVTTENKCNNRHKNFYVVLFQFRCYFCIIIKIHIFTLFLAIFIKTSQIDNIEDEEQNFAKQNFQLQSFFYILQLQ